MEPWGVLGTDLTGEDCAAGVLCGEGVIRYLWTPPPPPSWTYIVKVWVGLGSGHELAPPVREERLNEQGSLMSLTLSPSALHAEHAQ